MGKKFVNIENAFNTWLSTNMDTFKKNLHQKSNYIIDHEPLKEIIDSIQVDFKEDPYYSNTTVRHDDINIDEEGTYRYTGPGLLTIKVNVNQHTDSLDIRLWMFYEIIYHNVAKYMKFFGIHHIDAFTCADIEVRFMDFIIDDTDVYGYDDYNWESVGQGTNRYWERVDEVSQTLQESITTKIIGRKTVINNDGTVSVENDKGQMVKIRMYVKLLGDINVAKLVMKSDGLHVTGKAGRTEVIKTDMVREVISFVDTGKPDVLDSGSPFLPNISLKKV